MQAVSNIDEENKEEAPQVPFNQIVTKPLNLGTTFIQNGQNVTIPDILVKYKMLAVCFGASWCIISKDFIKYLTAFYEQINIEQKELQIIFVSLQKTEQDYKRFTKDMPWICVSFADPRIADLKEFYKVRSLPQVMILEFNGDPITATNARQDVYAGGEATFNKWVSLKAQI